MHRCTSVAKGLGMTESILLVDVAEGIATVTLNRPQAMNALSRDLRRTLVDAFIRFRDDTETGVIILTGSGRAFCAGLDLKELGSAAPKDTATAVSGNELIDALARCPQPIIGAINGFAITGGFELALA